MLNPFHATGLFLYPLKVSENQKFFYVFRVKWVKQSHTETNLLFHAIVCHFLANDMGGGWRKKMTKCLFGGGKLQKCYLASDLLFE